MPMPRLKAVWAYVGTPACAVLCAYGIFTLCDYACAYSSELGGFIAHTPRVVVLIPSAGVLLWTLIRKRFRHAAWTALATLPFVPSLLGLAPSVLFSNHLTTAHGNDVALRVMTFNVEKWSHGATAVVDLIRASSPDILCLQEAGTYLWLDAKDQRSDALFAQLPDYHIAGLGEIWILSKYPIEHTRIVHFEQEEGSRPLVLASVRIPNQLAPMQIGCLHLYPPYRFGGARESWHATARIRENQVAMLVNQLENGVDGEVDVLLGDFNTPATSQLLDPLLSTYYDVWSSRHVGLGYTAPAAFPVQRIDRIFVRNSLSAFDIHVVHHVASDHLAVLATLHLSD